MSVPLSLDDPRWQELKHAYGSAADIPGLLEVLREESTEEERKEAWEEVWSALCHQETVYEATYAAVPHLVEVAKGAKTLKERAGVYFFVPFAFACSKYPEATQCPREFADAFDVALKELESLILEDLKLDWPPLDLRYTAAGLLFLKGDPAGGKLLEAYDTLCDECVEWTSPFKFSVETFK
jgi:hypothetical protein